MADHDALARPVQYRLQSGTGGAVALNSINTLVGGTRQGVLLEEFDFSNVPGVGYTEKRAQDDGMDASDVYLGPRLIRLVGTVYGSGPGDLQDRVQIVRTALTPTVAYAADEPRYGYLPLEFELPTTSPDFPTMYRPLEFRARPRGQPQFVLRRDSGQGEGQDPLRGGAVQFVAVLECRDPRMYVRPQVWKYRHETQPDNADHPLTNRGDYPAPLDVLLELPPNAGMNQYSHVDLFVGDTQMRLNVPQTAQTQILRYSGGLKVATLEVGGVESLRMDLLQFISDSNVLAVPPGGGTIRWAPGGVANLGSNTRVMYSESFA